MARLGVQPVITTPPVIGPSTRIPPRVVHRGLTFNRYPADILGQILRSTAIGGHASTPAPPVHLRPDGLVVS